MERKSHHSPHKRTKIVSQLNSGVPATEIAAQEGLSKHAIYGIIRRYKHQQSARDQPRPGAPRIIKERDKRHILRIVDQDPFITTNKIINQTGLQYDKSTLIRFLRREGIMHYRALQRPFLRPTAARKRPAFAREFVNKGFDFWSR